MRSGEARRNTGAFFCTEKGPGDDASFSVSLFDRVPVRIIRRNRRILHSGVIFMPDHKKAVNDRDDGMPFLRLEPEKRMCPIVDPVSIYKYPLATSEEMGFRVLDNFPEEHIQ